MKILIVGDIHGRFGDFNNLLNKKKPDITIQCGDNALFWKKEASVHKIKPKGLVYFIPGNHEDFDLFELLLGRHGKEPIEINENVFFCPIGSSIVAKKHNILFVGGADSVDKGGRITRYDWFPQETLNSRDLDYILDNNEKADIVISHTCPTEFDMRRTKRFDKYNDPTRKALSYVLNHYQPKFWFFGHWHHSIFNRYKGTDWRCLNKAVESGWWYMLEL